MKTITYSNSEILFDAGLNSLNLSNREDAESGYENCFSDIENFFRKDFENDITEKDVLISSCNTSCSVASGSYI